MFKIPFRKQLRISQLSAETAGKFKIIWKNTRKYQIWLIQIYQMIEARAKEKGIDVPEPLTKMEVEK